MKKARLFRHRLKLGITQAQLAQKMALHRVTIAKLETYRYERLPLSHRIASALAAELGISPDTVQREYARREAR